MQFLIFGDDLIWNKKKFRNIPDATIIKHEEVILGSGKRSRRQNLHQGPNLVLFQESKRTKEEILGLDLALIYSCGDVIMSHGTFGIWAGIMVNYFFNLSTPLELAWKSGSLGTARVNPALCWAQGRV